MKRIVAVLPIGKLFDRVYADAIESAARETGAQSSRVAPEFSSAGTLGTLCKLLESADLVIADISARNAHVMFLAGYSLGIGRDVLFITQSAEDFPFDREKYPPIVYGSDWSFLRSELLSRFRGESKEKKSSGGGARERFLGTFGDLLEKHKYEHRGEVYLENPTTYVLVNQDMDLPLVQDLARRGRELGVRIKLM